MERPLALTRLLWANLDGVGCNCKLLFARAPGAGPPNLIDSLDHNVYAVDTHSNGSRLPVGVLRAKGRGLDEASFKTQMAYLADPSNDPGGGTSGYGPTKKSLARKTAHPLTNPQSWLVPLETPY